MYKKNYALLRGQPFKPCNDQQITAAIAKRQSRRGNPFPLQALSTTSSSPEDMDCHASVRTGSQEHSKFDASCKMPATAVLAALADKRAVCIKESILF